MMKLRTCEHPISPGVVSRRRSLPMLISLPTLLSVATRVAPIRRARADDVTGSPEGSSARLTMMRKIASAITVTALDEQGRPERVIALRPEPILRYSDPPRHMHDASMWAWGEQGRPAAVLKVELYPPHPPPRRWVLGMVALSPKRIAVEFHDGQRWSSSKPGLEPQQIPAAPPPGATEPLRLSQMKALARRFTGSENAGRARGELQLRLMPRPLDRYADPDSGLTDGVIFGFATGTNPDIFLVIEAWTRGTSPTWLYGFARNGGGDFTGSLDGKPVWKQGLANPPAQLETYMNRRIAEGTEP